MIYVSLCGTEIFRSSFFATSLKLHNYANIWFFKVLFVSLIFIPFISLGVTSYFFFHCPPHFSVGVTCKKTILFIIFHIPHVTFCFNLLRGSMYRVCRKEYTTVSRGIHFPCYGIWVSSMIRGCKSSSSWESMLWSKPHSWTM